MASDAEIRFERQSEQAPGMTPGDVIFKLKTQSHPRFRRDRDDLHMDLHLSLREALLGFQRSVKHLDGRDVPISHKGVTQPFEVRKVRVSRDDRAGRAWLCDKNEKLALLSPPPHIPPFARPPFCSSPTRACLSTTSRRSTGTCTSSSLSTSPER